MQDRRELYPELAMGPRGAISGDTLVQQLVDGNGRGQSRRESGAGAVMLAQRPAESFKRGNQNISGISRADHLDPRIAILPVEAE